MDFEKSDMISTLLSSSFFLYILVNIILNKTNILKYYIR